MVQDDLETRIHGWPDQTPPETTNPRPRGMVVLLTY